MGCSIVVLKCGTLGYYLKTANSDKLERMGRAKPQDCTVWANKELFSGIFKVEDVKSATGAGDTSIAAFLASILKGYAPERAITLACARVRFAAQLTVQLKPSSLWSKLPPKWTPAGNAVP